MPDVSFDRNRTEHRFQRLVQYAQDAKITPRLFACGSICRCNESLAEALRPLRLENCGGLVHVGEEYDVTVHHREFRILLVGKDYGGGSSDLAARRQCIQSLTENDLNWHYKGVVKTLLEVYQWRREDGWQCLLKRMAQTNATRCCAPRENRMACNTNYQMRLNCWPHFRAEIEILEPTLIIFHGADLAGPFQACLQREGAQVDQPLPGLDRCQHVKWTNFSNPFETVIVFMNHPFAARWRQFDWASAVEIINRLRPRHLPVFNTQWTPLQDSDWPRL